LAECLCGNFRKIQKLKIGISEILLYQPEDSGKKKYRCKNLTGGILRRFSWATNFQKRETEAGGFAPIAGWG
jgi:hypothetical protein